VGFADLAVIVEDLVVSLRLQGWMTPRLVACSEHRSPVVTKLGWGLAVLLVMGASIALRRYLLPGRTCHRPLTASGSRSRFHRA